MLLLIYKHFYFIKFKFLVFYKVEKLGCHGNLELDENFQVFSPQGFHRIVALPVLREYSLYSTVHFTT